ncbi:HEAT repeat domain-containing protein [Planctomycetota bacterium]
MDENEFVKSSPEKLYKKVKFSACSEELKEKVRHDLGLKVPQTTIPNHSPAGMASLPAVDVPRQGAHWPRRLLALAAALIIVFFSIKMLGRPRPETEESPSVPTVKSAKDEFYILHSQKQDKAIVVQKFSDFLISRRLKGDTLGGFVLVDVEENAVLLQNRQGETSRRLIAEMNSQAVEKLKLESAWLTDKFQSNELAIEDVERVKLIAVFGEKKAMRLLETIAASDSPLRQKADQFLTEVGPSSVVMKLVRRASAGQMQARKRAMRTLADLSSPLAKECLKEVATQNDEDMAILAIRMLCKKNNPQSLQHLQSIANQTSSDTVRQIVETNIQSIIRRIEHEK